MWRRALVMAGVAATGMGVVEYRGFVTGVLAASAFWVAARVQRKAPRGEAVVTPHASSRELLDGVPEWLAVHDLPAGGRTIDHVVVTPLAVLAVETAWWDEAAEDEHTRRRELAVRRARDNARAVKDLLAGRDLGFDLPVWPVVLTWGPGAEDSQAGLVDVVSGADAGAWAMAYSSGAIAPAVAERVHAGLLRVRARRSSQRSSHRTSHRTKADHARAA